MYEDVVLLLPKKKVEQEPLLWLLAVSFFMARKKPSSESAPRAFSSRPPPLPKKEPEGPFGASDAEVLGEPRSERHALLALLVPTMLASGTRCSERLGAD